MLPSFPCVGMLAFDLWPKQKLNKCEYLINCAQHKNSFVNVCVCVCVRERQMERGKERERERERERESNLYRSFYYTDWRHLTAVASHT